ncbi:MAG: L,D-transpeptidase family protein [Saprospiraceae bacterium]|nr:L,D-transpeptidase family protein [Saprospiraceae bacterium]
MILHYKKPLALLTVILIYVSLLSCEKIKKRFVSQDDSVYAFQEYNTQLFDSSRLYQFLDNLCTEDLHCEEIFSFYRRRNFHYAWIDNGKLGISANTFITRIQDYRLQFKDTSLIDNAFFQILDTASKDSCFLDSNADIQRKIEFQLTAIFFKYATKEYYGIEKNLKDLEWYIPRKKKDFQHLLDTLVNAPKSYEIYEPLNQYYKGLKSTLKKYRDLELNKDYKVLTISSENEKTEIQPKLIIQLKKNLYLLGDLPSQDSIAEMDSTLIASIQKFQSRFNIEPSGIIDQQTLTELNIPIKERIKQILINLERLRWFPDSVPSNYLIVNIPEYKLHVIENDSFKWSMNVVVGKEANATNIFMGTISHVAFSPYWNIPTSIIRNEILPKVKSNPSYLDRNNMEIVSNGKVLSSSSINWSKYSLGVPFTIRQKPGTGNALGGIKFLFPNSFSIYLHDTPSKSLFKENERAFSHGCIRLGEPAKLAKYVFRSDTSYSIQRIKTLMSQKSETITRLSNPIPVFITYLTCWVNHKGELNFRKDLYGHDKKLYDEVFAKI